MKIDKWKLGLAAAGLVSLSPSLIAQTTNDAAATTNAAPQIIPLQTALSATTISGYVDTSAVWNPGTGNVNPAPYAFNTPDKRDGFNVNSADVKISRAEDETSWAAGYTLELNYGEDARAIDGGDGSYPIRQAYIELKMPIGNGLDWQIGRWDNLLGYEVSSSMSNPNYTRSYGYTFEPTEHTGVLASYKVCDAVNLQAGVVDTITTSGINARSDGGPVIESKKGFVSLVTLTAPDSWGAIKGSTLVGGFDYGWGNHDGFNDAPANVPGAGGPGQDRTEYYVGTTINTPVKGLTFGGAWDYIHGVDVLVDGGALNAEYVSAVAAYGSFQIDKLTLNTRAEYANGPGLTALLYAADGEAPGFGGSGAPFNKVLALTGTVQYDLWANVITRLEVRWDHACDGSTPFGGVAGMDADSTGGKKNELMIAANVIYKF